MTIPAQLIDKKAQAFAASVGEPFKGAPHLPKAWVTFLVGISPILSLIAAAAMALSGLMSLGFGMFGLIGGLLSIATAAILFMAYEPLKAKKYDGWMLMFWSTLISAIAGVLSLASGQNALIEVFAVIVSLYVVFELRASYK